MSYVPLQIVQSVRIQHALGRVQKVVVVHRHILRREQQTGIIADDVEIATDVGPAVDPGGGLEGVKEKHVRVAFDPLIEGEAVGKTEHPLGRLYLMALVAQKDADLHASATELLVGVETQGCRDDWHAGAESAEIETTDGRVFRTQIRMQMQTGDEVDLFLRPEAMLIEPDAGLANLNRFEVFVKDLLFDGANSRLLANPLDADTELLIALPQTHQYDYIQKDDKIEIGWDEQSGICFPRRENQD